MLSQVVNKNTELVRAREVIDMSLRRARWGKEFRGEAAVRCSSKESALSCGNRKWWLGILLLRKTATKRK